MLLAKQGVDVSVVEKTEKLDDQPRATHYGPPAVYELARAGVLDEVNAMGFLPGGVCWRKLDGTRLTGINTNIIPKDYPYKLVCLPLDKLGKILLKHVQALPNITTHWGHNVVNLGQNATEAWIETESSEGPQTFRADYIVGCDGARSQIRRSLFGEDFPGMTWDEQIVATNVCLSNEPASEL